MIRIGTVLPGCRLFPEEGKDNRISTYQSYLEGFALREKLGIDFLESSVGTALSLTDEEAADLAAKGVKIEALNCFIPGTFSIENPTPELEEHVKKTMKRASVLGVETIVFGSGKARTMSEGLSDEQRTEKLVAFLRMCEPYAADAGVTVVIEPLNTSETNVANTVASGLALAKAADCPHVRLLADVYHMFREPDPDAAVESLAEALPYLRHIHLGSSDDRKTLRADDAYLRKCAEKLKAIGYSGRVSIETGFPRIPDDLLASIKVESDLFR